MSVVLIGKQRYAHLGTLALDREPESPTVLVESYLDDLASVFQ